MEKCPDCGKEFETVEALGQHRSAKHGASQPKVSKAIKKINMKPIVVIVAVIALAGVAFVVATGPGKYDDFARCVSEKGAQFYGAFWCPHCAEQKHILGSSMKYINYVECSTPDGKSQLEVCTQAGVKGYPTWIFADGSKVESVLQPSGLALKTGCTAP